MKISSEIYGEFELESVFVEAIESNSIQRLKDISQFGIPSQYFWMEEGKCYSRFKHSIGVMLLLRKLKATTREQLAGLIHDVSHTCFSHVVDWIVGSQKQESFQDDHHQEYVLNSELPKVLKKYGYDAEKLADESRFSLLEQEIPNLCADRIDYLLQEIPPDDAKKLAGELTTRESKIVFENKEAAFNFANYFLDRQVNRWGSYETITRYRLLADALSEALEGNILKFDDFWGTESPIIRKLEECNNKKIKRIIKLLKRDSLKDLPKSDKVEEKKFRWVDPKFVVDDEVKKLSSVSSNFRKRVIRARKKNRAGKAIPDLSQI